MLDYGIIGNCKTCALVRKNGVVEWMCYPRFDSPSVFAKILDRKIGGSLGIIAKGYKTNQRYLENSAILETTFTSDESEFVVYDFFPRYKKIAKRRGKLKKRNEIIRIIKPVKGKPTLKITYDPQPDYARAEVTHEITEKGIKSNGGFGLVSNIPYETILSSDEIVLDRTRYLVFGGTDVLQGRFSVTHCTALLRATRSYWRDWVKTLILPETNRDTIIRSAITLKLLTYSETGAIVAAATTSIPEEKGSERTWDYRFCWVRDAALCVDALKKIGRDYEAKGLLEFIINNVRKDDFIQIMYGINSETRLREQTLDHLEGFHGSKPVRIGNGAYNQVQHDIYGQVLDIIYLYFVYYEYEKKLTKRYWQFIIYLVNQIKFTWDRPDSGIWEFRDLLRHYTYSKFMCYVGVDRAIKIAQHYNKTERMQEWLDLRDEIREDILKKAYDPELEAFTMYYGSKELDASVLQMAYYEFLDDTDPRIIGTIKAIYNHLRHDYLVKRYDAPDDFGTTTSSFTICSFWLVDALYTIGDEERAREIFNKLVAHANHLGLFSEDIDIKSRKLIGNFPQAYTHIALINSSILLSEWSSKRKKVIPTELPKKKRWF